MIDFFVSIAHNKTEIEFNNEYQQIIQEVNGLFFNLVYCKRGDVRLYESKSKIFLTDANPSLVNEHNLRNYLGSGHYKEIPGFFTILMMDFSTGLFTLINDRFASQEIYYSFNNDLFTIFSDFKHAFEVGEHKPKINFVGLNEFLNLGHTNAPNTILESVYKLNAASVLNWNKTQLDLIRYFDFFDEFSTEQKSFNSNFSDTSKQFEEAVFSNFKHLANNSKATILLSSGMDSSYLAIKAKEIYEDVDALTIGQQLGDERYNEADDSRIISKLIGISQDIKYIDFNYIEESVDTLLDLYPELFGDTAQITVLRMAQSAQKDNDYVCGEGVDSLLYSSENDARSALKNFNRSKLIGELLCNPTVQTFEPNKLRTAQDLYVNEWECIMPSYLRKTNAIFSAYGLRVLFPYLDANILSVCFGLPDDFKKREEKSKYLLRNILNKYIPYDSLALHKRGAGVPVHKYLIKYGKQSFDIYFDEKRIQEQGIFDYAKIREVLFHFFRDEQYNGVKLHGLVWRLFLFQKWYDRYIR